MSSEHITYLREVLEHDAIGFGEDFQFQDAVEHLEALEHASEQYRKAMSEQAKRIEQLEAALRDVIDSWDWWQINTYDRCASVPGDAIATARAALEGKDD